jgi:aromatic ring-cleaving dioxygenase
MKNQLNTVIITESEHAALLAVVEAAKWGESRILHAAHGRKVQAHEAAMYKISQALTQFTAAQKGGAK